MTNDPVGQGVSFVHRLSLQRAHFQGLHLARPAPGGRLQWRGLDQPILERQRIGHVAHHLAVVGHDDDGVALLLQFEKGVDSQVEILRKQVGSLKAERDSFSAELDDLRRKYAGTQEDQRTINEQLRQERVKRERIERVSDLYRVDEAKVLQDGKNVIIRLTGFTFPSGTSVIEPVFFPLLTKVQESIEEFPSSHIAIEGHTDSKGEDSYNLKLSQKRADAIRTYLVANLGINPERIVAVGYGESRPIANNDTDQGRSMNRRVDVVIEPRD